MAWKRIGDKEYSCMYNDVKPTTDTNDAEGISEGASLIEVQADGSLKNYLFYQGAWRGGTTV